jgi:hypothetical protein
LVVGYIAVFVFPLPLFLTLSLDRGHEIPPLEILSYLLCAVASFSAPYLIGGFLIYNSRKKRFIVPTAILLIFAMLCQSFVCWLAFFGPFA